ncbi:hypothetical protein [Nonomuraea sp. GTA35]|uniref:nSTAND1 domain-containing NTPase n=1 Tax=Nonomuraea sp. GTA35 TaxID=1676746 RepID=UPI0035BFBB79
MADSSRARLSEDESQQMRAGIRARIARDARWLRRLTPTAFVAVLSASALAPVAGAAAGGMAAEGLSVLGSVGANVLTEVVMGAIARLRGGDGAPPDTAPPAPELIERELAERLMNALTDEGVRAQALRAELAVILEEIGAVRTAMEAAVATGDPEYQARVADLLADLSGGFDEFAFVLSALLGSAASIQQMLRRQDAEHRADRDWLRNQSISLRLIEEKISLVERRTRIGLPRGAEDGDWAGACPYRGLWPFEPEHADVFHGRERMTADLVGKVAETLEIGGMVVVTGASGAGKSSLLRAGLVPALARGALLPGSQNWPRVLITPGRTPLDELAAHVAALGRMDTISVRDGLSRRPELAHLLVRQALLSHEEAAFPSLSSQRLILMIDQFEEVFTAGDGTQTEAFIGSLAAMSGLPEPAALVILGVRGDYWARCAAHPQLAPALREGQFLVGPMSRSELRRAISGPAEHAGLVLEPGLADAVLGDLRPDGDGTLDETGVLPLLSQAMLITWENRDGHRLTSRGYGRSGGVARAVQHSAESAFRSLAPQARELAQHVILHLTAVTAGGRTVRRRVRRADLPAAVAGAAEDVAAVLDVFAAARLVVLSENAAELAHDVLFDTWPRLRGWLREEEGERLLYSQLLDDAGEWRRNGDDPSFLYRGTQLASVLAAASRWTADSRRYPAMSGGLVQEFLGAASTAEDGRRRGRRRSRGVLATLLATALAASGFATERAMSAGRQSELRLARETADRADSLRTSSPAEALLLSVAAWRMAPDDLDAAVALYGALAQRELHVLRPSAGAGATRAALSHDGATLAEVRDGKLSLRDVAGGQAPARAGLDLGGEVTAIALSPDDAVLAVGSSSAVQLWDLRTGKPDGAPFGLAGADELAFNGDGSVLTMLKIGGGGQAWAVTRLRERVWHSAASDLEGIEVSADGSTVLTISDGKGYELFDRRHRPIPAPGPVDPSSGGAAGFAPDGRTLAVTTEAGVRFWDLAARRWADGLLRDAVPYDLAFDANGTHVATYDASGIALWQRDGTRVLSRSADEITGKPRLDATAATLSYLRTDGQVTRFDVATLTSRTELVPHATYAAIDPQARAVAVQGDTMVLAGPGRTPLAIGASTEQPVRAAFSPDGHILATSSGAAPEVTLWDAATGNVRGVIKVDDTDWVSGLAFTPDGQELAVAPRRDNAWQDVRLVNTERPDAPARTIGSPGGPRMAFSADGRLLAVNGAEANGVVELATGRPHPQLFGSGGSGGRPLAIDPAGTLIAAGGTGMDVDLWDAVTLRKTRTLRGPADELRQLSVTAFSPDGLLLAAGDTSGGIWLWNVRDNRLLGSPVAQHAGGVLALAFTADGAALTSVGADGALRDLPIAPARAAAEVCRRAHAALDEAAWRRLTSQQEYRQVC